MQMAYRIFKLKRMKLFSVTDREIHLYHFSPRTIKAYLQETGFNCLRLSPDYGIVDFPKKVINMAAVVAYYLLGIKIFNAIEIYAIKKDGK